MQIGGVVCSVVVVVLIFGCSSRSDDDGGGISNIVDNCPIVANEDQFDSDGDGLGDVCDTLIDSDGDLVGDDADNCPTVYNPDQTAMIGTIVFGDACDDEDADAIVDALDNCPRAINSDQRDTNGNGVGDACEYCGSLSMVADHWPGTVSSETSGMTLIGDTLYFTASDFTHGFELWAYEPSAGFMLAADVVPGESGSGPRWLTVLNNKLYFAISGDDRRDELWVYDPAAGQASIVESIDIPSEKNYRGIRDFIALNGKLYFMRSEYSLGSSNWKLWMYDPMTDNAATITFDADIRPNELVELDNILYFTATDPVHGMELWSYDPAYPGTGAQLTADIVPGKGESEPSALTGIDGKLYFAAWDGNLSRGLWEYSPSEGVIYIDDAHGWPPEFIELNGKIYFSADDDDRIWNFNPIGRDTGVKLVIDIRPDSVETSIGGLIAVQGKLYFGVVFYENDSVDGDKLWVYDPAEPSTGAYPIVDPHPADSGDSIFYWLGVMNDRFYYYEDHPASGKALWVFDPACTM